MIRPIRFMLIPLVLSICLFGAVDLAQNWHATVVINWNKVVRITKTVPTYQIVGSPLMLPNSPIHDQVYRDIHNLGADFVRYQAWYPFPKIAVAELKPPHDGKTYWDFKYMDAIVVDFLKATQGHKVIMNLATIPEWMFKTPKPVPYPADPSQLDPGYEQGTELRDPTMKEVAGYFARLASWYTKGGFKDEYGHWHESGYHFRIPYWEVLNEVEAEHRMSPETYTRLYDAVVQAIQRVDPNTNFVGLALAEEDGPWLQRVLPDFFYYFLNHKNHAPGIPLDMISYHFYATPASDENPYVQQFTVFDDVDRFLAVVKYIQAIGQHLSPETRTDCDELGIISADDMAQGEPGHVAKPIPDSYWNLSAAEFAYLYLELSHLGINAAGMSSGLGFPNYYYPSVTMMDWRTGQPNARYWALKLLIENAGPGDKQVATASSLPFVAAQAYITPTGTRKVLLVNKRNSPFEVTINHIDGAKAVYVDQETNFHPPASNLVSSDSVVLDGYEVCVLTLL